MKRNFNSINIRSDCGTSSQEDFGVVSRDGKIEVVFKNLEERLIEKIEQASIVVGCIAWFTNKNIILSLSKKDGVAIVVQKEDFLRPDIDTNSRWAESIRKLYETLPDNLCRFDFEGTVLRYMSFAGDPMLQPLRCVGGVNTEKSPAFPRAHHKFVVFCHSEFEEDESGDTHKIIIPDEVWTGSFNFTKNAGMSFENAVIIQDNTIVSAYFNEWAQIEALSEELNWDSVWVAPTWRIGT